MSNLAKQERLNLDFLTRKIQGTVQNIAKDFLYIGFLLYEAQCYEYYLEGGYKNIYEYAQEELGFKKSSAYNFIKVYDRFGGNIKHQGPDYQITTHWAKFSYSQLTEMLSLTDKQLEKVSPDMTVKELRLLKGGKSEDQQLSRRLENEMQSFPDLRGYMTFESDELDEDELVSFLKKKVVKLRAKGFKVVVGYYKWKELYIWLDFTSREMFLLHYLHNKSYYMENEMIQHSNFVQQFNRMDEIDHLERIMLITRNKTFNEIAQDIYNILLSSW